jgi:hypothetical protein
MGKWVQLKALRAWEKVTAAMRWAREPLRLTAILCTGLFTVGTLARSAELPSKEAWALGGAYTWALLATGFVTAGWQVYVNRDRRRRKRSTALSEACQRIAAHIDESCPGLELKNVGVHVWIIGGPPAELRLKRGAQFLLRERQPSAVIWTKGKGVIGTCWERKAPVIVDLDAHFAHRARNRQTFCSLGGSERFNLAWDEYERTRRYKTIWAAPLFDRTETPHIRGVLSIDVQQSGQHDALLAATVGNTELQGILGVCESALKA